ncbi:MAG: hypothetical protein K0S61_2641 [Anaerocolumna sp.]|jgi:1A family penicillin-binding protein|nr:hypothetical protein [Anaerocolumna sp.]
MEHSSETEEYMDNKNNRQVTGTRNASNKTDTNKNGNRNSSNSKKKHKKHKKYSKNARLIFLLVSLVFSLAILLGCAYFYLKYGEGFINAQKNAKKFVAESTLDTFRQSETSLVYDNNKKLISVLKGEKDVYYLEYKDIPVYATQAMISIEDKKFLNHPGIDIQANIRSVLALIKHRGKITQGASTITQQLARNIFLTHNVTYERKLNEIFIALELEKKYNKNQIMEFYLNNIYFANGFYGIQAASKGYFNKDVNKLSLSQIVYLCAIPNNPTIYDPFDYPENTVKRRDRILTQMYEDGKIGKEDYDKAVNEKITVKQRKMTTNNYVQTFVFYSATRALMAEQGFEFRNTFDNAEDKKSYDEAYTELYNQCQNSLYHKGYRIYTSIDMSKQSLLQNAVDETLKANEDMSEEGVYAFQGAAVSIDNETGRVVAIVGGRSQKSLGYTLNRAYQSFRQPGSSIKPLIVYTPSFEKGYYPDNIVLDEKFEGGPSNSNNNYAGEITIRSAVEQSKNVIAWKLFEELTPKVGLSYLLNMNYTKISKNDYYPASSLGGFTNGASPVEMTSGFATLANDGVYREPTCIVKIKDSEGDVIVDDLTAKKRIYDVNAARMMTDVLTGVIKNGTGKGLGLNNIISAGKTGTTNDKKDGWFVGYTPYYTTGVWVGYDIPKSVSGLAGATYPGTIWKVYMNEIHKDLPLVGFQSYEDTRPKPTVTPTPSPTPEITEEPTQAPTDIEDPDDIWNPGGEGENNPGGEVITPTPTYEPPTIITPTLELTPAPPNTDIDNEGNTEGAQGESEDTDVFNDQNNNSNLP